MPSDSILVQRFCKSFTCPVAALAGHQSQLSTCMHMCAISWSYCGTMLRHHNTAYLPQAEFPIYCIHQAVDICCMPRCMCSLLPSCDVAHTGLSYEDITKTTLLCQCRKCQNCAYACYPRVSTYFVKPPFSDMKHATRPL